MLINLNDSFMSREISLDFRFRAFNVYVYSIILYGEETCTLYVESTKKLEALEMYYSNAWQELTTKIEWQMRKFLSRLGVERGLLFQIRTHKMSYFGHIARHGSL